jgi:VanZ family protein
MTTSPTHLLHRRDDAALQAGQFAVGCLIYAVFVVYGSLVPLDYQHRPLADALAAFRHTPYLRLGVASRADWVANILLYIPLAFLGAGTVTAALRSRAAKSAGVIAVALACIALAFAVEFAQLFFPPRTVSQNDLIAETTGTLIGIVLWLLAGKHLAHLWRTLVTGGGHSWQALAALYAIAYLAYSLFPYDFLISAAELREKLAGAGRPAFIAAESCGPVLGCATKLLLEIAVVAPLGALLGRAFPALGIRAALLIGMALGAAIETAQILLASGTSQGVSVLTRGLGMAWGLALQRHFQLRWVTSYRREIRIALAIAAPLYLALLAHINGFGGGFEPVWAAAEKLSATKLLPFYYHYYTTETAAVASLLGNAGAYAVIGVAAWLLWPNRKARWVTGGVAGLVALGIEILKLFTVTKKPDPTNLLIAFAAAWAAHAVLARLSVTKGAEAENRTVDQLAPLPVGIALGGALTLVAVILGGLLLASPKYERPVDETLLPQLPPGEELPEAILPGFRFAHPRLPHPTVTDLAALSKDNPAFLRDAKQRAAGGKGDLGNVILQARLEPGSVDLDLLHRRLMALTPEWRGHEQGKPLALAYDWLHDQWSSTQRQELLGKVVGACNYLIDYIRKERLSPYNVYLYNSPFQALVACSLATYGDDPRADPVMRFTDDYWKQRVLPVWRQIMGRNGGWHEGGEYVAIGIGQAIYQVPAMWRHATGEDYFATEPGIRGFLDFLIYRTRPDGTHFRWGDGGYYENHASGAVPLALELRHPAAYSLTPPAKLPTPTSWPWGPLTDPTLNDPNAITRLPLTQFFDGIGLVVARSDWTPNATYVTFKTGDNYWSHSHLDQGAFTIYKGGPLAIDSGFYGPSYGSDHHMNYTYQTIAHNTVTVTDPADTVPAPGKERPRPIANDGGQRRIGSGWGVEAAPLDIKEWRDKQAIYHTGTMARVFDQDGLTIAIADVTPAYTNADSGEGTFSHRTRRVERFWRTFAYDRVDDVVIIFDAVEATDAAFRKRWLLHTIDEPAVTPGGFSIRVPPQKRPGRPGGGLEGKVLLPQDSSIQTVGGAGFEFFVDDRNFDENGTLWEMIRKRGASGPEPGAWRVEVSPAQEAREDHFLVVLLPSAVAEEPRHHVRLLESGDRVGCEIVGPTRTTRWWFAPSRMSSLVEVSDAAGVREHDIQVDRMASP